MVVKESLDRMNGSRCWVLLHRSYSTKKASNHHANLPLEMYSFTL